MEEREIKPYCAFCNESAGVKMNKQAALQWVNAHWVECPKHPVREYEKRLAVAHEALKAARSILWMAQEYADSGGSGGPEGRDFKEAESAILYAIGLTTP